MSGAYRPGQRVMPQDVAAELGVSVMPIREALIALSSEGLLELLPNRGFRVVEVTRQDVDDLFHVHAMIAGHLADRAAQVVTAQALAELRSLQDQVSGIASQRLSKHERSARVEELNYRFHRAINVLPDAKRLRWFLRAAARFIPRQFYESIPGWVEATINDHPPIIAALAKHDGLQ